MRSLLPSFGSNSDCHSALYLKKLPFQALCVLRTHERLLPWLTEASEAPYAGVERPSVIVWVPASISKIYLFLPSSELLLCDTMRLTSLLLPLASPGSFRSQQQHHLFSGCESFSGAPVVPVFPRLCIYDVTLTSVSFFHAVC